MLDAVQVRRFGFRVSGSGCRFRDWPVRCKVPGVGLRVRVHDSWRLVQDMQHPEPSAWFRVFGFRRHRVLFLSHAVEVRRVAQLRLHFLLAIPAVDAEISRGEKMLYAGTEPES